MKKYYFSFVVSLLVLISVSCEEEDKFAPKTLSDGTVLFSVDAKALTGGSLVGVVQPSYDVVSARFSKATVASPNYFSGNAVISVVLSSELTKLTVNLVANSGTREVKGTYVNGIWSAPLSTIGLGGTTPANNSTIVLEFVATSSDGSKRTARMFSVTVLA